MFSIHAERLAEVPSFIATMCIPLCNMESESQQLFRRVATRYITPDDRECVMAYAWTDANGDVVVIGWATLTYWHVAEGDSRPQVNTFVAEGHRRRGLAAALCACISPVVTKVMGPVCVFSPLVSRIAKRLGWDSRCYQSVDDGWIAVDGVVDGIVHESDAGVHVAAHPVRSLSLACGETGEDS